MIVSDKHRTLLLKWKERHLFWNSLSINQRDIVNRVLTEEEYGFRDQKPLNEIRQHWIEFTTPEFDIESTGELSNPFVNFFDAYTGEYFVGTDTAYINGSHSDIKIYTKEVLDID